MSVFDSKSDGFIYNTILNENANKGQERGGRITLLYTSDATTATLYLNATGIDQVPAPISITGRPRSHSRTQPRRMPTL